MVPSRPTKAEFVAAMLRLAATDRDLYRELRAKGWREVEKSSPYRMFRAESDKPN